MYKFWYDYVKPKDGKKSKLCYMETDSFIVYIKTDDIFKDIAEDVATKFGISNYEVECNSTERPLPIAKSEKAIGLMKNELEGKTMTTFVGLRAKTYSYLIDDGSEEKRKAKDTKKCVLRRKPKFKYYKTCLKETQLENEIII